MMLKEKEIIEKLKKEQGYQNSLAVPRIIKVVVNVGLGQSKTNPHFGEIVEKSLLAITGQKPAFRPARKAVAGFKIRQGEKVGLVITLRGQRMKDFIIKLANVVLPRMRDFRGLKIKGFDRQGNYTLGIKEQIVFPEISPEKAEVLHGLSIRIQTTAKNPEEGKTMLEAWGLPFEKPQGKPFEKEKNG